MAKWNVELCYGIGFTVTDVEADTQDRAIGMAKSLVLKDTIVMTDSQVEAGNLEYDQCAYVQKENETKWNVELCCGIGFTVTGIDADTEEQAIESAKSLVLDGTTILTGIHVSEGDLEYDQCTYIKEV